jgi:DNA-binding transcriptional ArsR family regulator
MAALETCTRRHKALANPARLRIMAMLENGELCACQLIAVLGLAPSTVSRHVAELRSAGLLTERKDGRWVHYALAAGMEIDAVLEPIRRDLREDPQICADREQVERLRTVAVEVLCEAGRDLTRLAEMSEVRDG